MATHVTALHRAAGLGNLDELRRLIDAGVPVDARDDQGCTPLMVAAGSPAASVETLKLLMERGADVNAIQEARPKPTVPALDQASLVELGIDERIAADFATPQPESLTTPLMAAIDKGTLAAVAFLLNAGADATYVDACGYGAALRAVYRHLRTPFDEAMPVLRRLVEAGAPLDVASLWHESPVRTAAGHGRFDLATWLLRAGASDAPLGWDPLFLAIASGDPPHVEAHLSGESLARRDSWNRTPLLLAVQAGAIDMVECLLAHGADLHERGHCGQSALHLATQQDHGAMVEWLVAHGVPVAVTNDFGQTPLQEAVENDATNAARALLKAGADATSLDSYARPMIASAMTREMIEALIAHGADWNDIGSEARKEFFGRGSVETAPDFSGVEAREPRGRMFGTANPSPMNSPYRGAMIRSRASAYAAETILANQDGAAPTMPPTWSFARFGQSLIRLPDGRFIEIGGEHEDHYDPDFCIYNDVVVHHPDGGFDLFGYPEAIFPPTDFHSATFLDGFIYIIGCLGYPKQRRVGFTPVYRLNIATMAIDEVRCAGDAPGWIYGHRARVMAPGEIEISGGKIVKDHEHLENDKRFRLTIATRRWTQGQ